MDWKLFGSTFALIFIAEMGDKTQLATLGLCTGAAARWTVFAAAALALIATTAIAVTCGELIARHVPLVWLKRGSGVLFIILGVMYLVSARSA